MSSERITALIMLGLVALLGLGFLSHAPADEEALAKKLLIMRGHIDDPKIVSLDDGSLYVATASGHFEFVAQPSCDEGLPCMLGLSMLCWDLQD